MGEKKTDRENKTKLEKDRIEMQLTHNTQTKTESN